MNHLQPVSIRPYQLMCLVCRGATAEPDAYDHAGRLDELAALIRAHPEQPLTLRCNVDSVYAWQNPGPEWDTSEGTLFNTKRDLDVLRALGLVPGDTRPALELMTRLITKIPVCRGICGYGTVTAPEWKGCRWAASGNYEAGVSRGVAALTPPRSVDDKARCKAISCTELYAADRLRIRPHHLLCMACFQGGKTDLAPIAEDNLFEAIDAIQKKPDIRVELISGPCMICPPCSTYDPQTGWCIGGNGMGLRDEKKDLDTLQRLGLKYGDIRSARELYELLFARIGATLEICGYGDGRVESYEWTICPGAIQSGSAPTAYACARASGLGIKGVTSGSAERIDT
jgi:hypothetical protein